MNYFYYNKNNGKLKKNSKSHKAQVFSNIFYKNCAADKNRWQ